MRKIPQQKTPQFKLEMQVGAALADMLPKQMSLSEAAKQFKMSKTMIRRIECRALFKLYCLMQDKIRSMEYQEQLDIKSPSTNYAVPAPRYGEFGQRVA